MVSRDRERAQNSHSAMLVSRAIEVNRPYQSVQQFLERGIGIGSELGRNRVMLLGLFSGWRRGSRVNDSEVEMRVGVIWIVRNCFKQFFFGGFLPTFLTRSDTEVIVCRCALRIEPERFRQFSQRLVKFRLPIINDAERGVSEFVFRRERDR